MKAKLLRLADDLHQSYWFLPTIMAFAAVLLAGGMILLDSYEGSGWMDRFAWLYASRPSGARQVLSAIGGSMITVAGTVFSVTIAAVVYASGQYGPRLLSNFMRDRGNQVTLGTFIATFLYCLLVLRTVRSPEESGGLGFVPNMALLVAVLLAICSIAVLIFFIHHVPSKIHINSVIEDVGSRLLREVGRRFPECVGEPYDPQADPDDPALPAAFRRDPGKREAEGRVRICADRTGYILLVEDDALLERARRQDVVLRLQYQPGDFTHAGRTLAEAWPAERCDEDFVDEVREAFSIGSQRTALQDLRFLIDELVEIAARALSPGVNDPFTAVTCLDWLGAAMSDLAGRTIPSHLRKDEDGDLRVIAHPLSFGYFLDRALGALVQYCRSDRIAALRHLEVIGEVAMACDDQKRIDQLAELACRMGETAKAALPDHDGAQVAERARLIQEALRDPAMARRLRDDAAWLGGTA